MGTKLSLIVLYANDLETTLRFYTALDLNFAEEQHGKGPVHHACELDSMVIEIYPARADMPDATTVMLGFHVETLATVLERLARMGVTPSNPPKESPWGLRCVVTDPDGRRVDITQPS
jgi:predicted enzyme related to lactoylglutathione lyase